MVIVTFKCKAGFFAIACRLLTISIQKDCHKDNGKLRSVFEMICSFLCDRIKPWFRLTVKAFKPDGAAALQYGMPPEAWNDVQFGTGYVSNHDLIYVGSNPTGENRCLVVKAIK